MRNCRTIVTLAKILQRVLPEHAADGIRIAEIRRAIQFSQGIKIAAVSEVLQRKVVVVLVGQAGPKARKSCLSHENGYRAALVVGQREDDDLLCLIRFMRIQSDQLFRAEFLLQSISQIKEIVSAVRGHRTAEDLRPAHLIRTLRCAGYVLRYGPDSRQRNQDREN